MGRFLKTFLITKIGSLQKQKRNTNIDLNQKHKPQNSKSFTIKLKPSNFILKIQPNPKTLKFKP